MTKVIREQAPMKLRKRTLTLIFILSTIFGFASAWSQNTLQIDAKKFADIKDYDKAIELYKSLYAQTPEDVYAEYLNTLIEAKKYKDAEKLVQPRIDKQIGQFPELDIARVYKAWGKEGKAKEREDEILRKLNGDDMLTQRIVKAYINIQDTPYAISAYERAIQLIGTPALYAGPLGTLYANSGKLENAMDVILLGGAGQFITVDNVKALFLQWMGTDPEKLRTGQKYLVKRLNEHPDNTYLADLLTWIYTQKNDWDGALLQMEAIDERNKETGRRLLAFGNVALAAHQYETAIKSFTDVVNKGSDQPYYTTASKQLLDIKFQQLKSAPSYKTEDAAALLPLYDSFLAQYPQYYASSILSDEAEIAAQYADSVGKGIRLLKKALKMVDEKNAINGNFKLQLGDYYVLCGKVWEAALVYGQVEKTFKQDVLGENARFRSARLAYYRGDFPYAQYMLGILKASTTELIANDALDLSVQITENIEDSESYPLSRFAYADLLLFQNKDKQAEVLLDSISTAFPKHPLNDDILMLHAKIAMKHHMYDTTLAYLDKIIMNYGTDVLGDDALFRSAEIYQNNLKKPEDAKRFYEKLIIDFPGSTFVQTARQRLKELNNPVAP